MRQTRSAQGDGEGFSTFYTKNQAQGGNTRRARGNEASGNEASGNGPRRRDLELVHGEEVRVVLEEGEHVLA